MCKDKVHHAKVHLIDGDSFVVEYESFIDRTSAAREAWHQWGIDINPEAIEDIEPAD